MKSDKSDYGTAKMEELKAELVSIKQLMVTQNNQILKSVQAIQKSLSVDNNSVIDQKIKLEEKPPTDESTWNVKKAEGNVEFGNDELITTKGFYGLVRALESLPYKEKGFIFFELKIIYTSSECGVQIGISQKFTAMSSLYFFDPFYSYQKYCSIWSGEHLIGCAIKFSAGKMFITWNGKVEKTLDLTGLKHGEGVDQKLTVKLCGKGCSVQLGRIEMSNNEDKCPF